MPRWSPDGIERLQDAAFDLFDERGFEGTTIAAIAQRARGTEPAAVVVRGLQHAAEATFEGRREAVVRRHAVIAANPDLQERERTKQAALAEAVAGVLEARGVDRDTALLVAGVGLLVQQAAFERWARPGETRSLRRLLSDAARQLRSSRDLDLDLDLDADTGDRGGANR